MFVPLTVDVTGWWINRITQSGVADADDKSPADLVGALPFVRVRRVGGGDDGYLLDAPSMAFECYAPDQAAANRLAYSVRALAASLRGPSLDGASLTAVRKIGGPTEVPYTNPDVSLSTLTLQTLIQATI